MVKKLLLAGALAVVFCGCVSTPPNKEQMSSAVTQAAAAASSHGPEYAVGELEKLTKRDPTSALPWSQIARIRFDQEKYGQAIVAADEAIQRDPDDFSAKTIWVVGGLRLAQQGILNMKNDAKLKGDARADAQTLANEMRKVLGTALFSPRRAPTPKPAVTPTVEPPKPNNKPPIPDREDNSSSGAGRNPFDVFF